MTKDTIIICAVVGGWIPKGSNWKDRPLSWKKQAAVNRAKFIERYLLDPKFWQAVGSVEGWGMHKWRMKELIPGTWFFKWHGMLDALAEGKTIEQYLETL